MKEINSQRTIYSWDFIDVGLFQCTTWDRKITDLRFCKEGSSLEGKCLWVTENCEEFLKKIHEALGELIDKGVIK